MTRNSFQRRTLLPTEYMFGFDSTQGYLAFAASGIENQRQIAFGDADENDYSSHLYRLKQLAREGYIEAEWSVSTQGEGETYHSIRQMCLTTKGHELLERLQGESGAGQLKRRLKDLAWVVVTSVCTTLVVLYIRGV